MRPDAFAELLESASEALAHARGKRSLKTATLPRLVDAMDARGVRAVRKSLRASQGLLALYLNVSTKLVQAWEADRRTPDGPALVLLHMISRQPGLLDTFYARPAARKRSLGGAGSAIGKRRVAVARQ